MGDNFSEKTKRILAARVGYHCSNPTCVVSTSGPALEEDRKVNIGVSAHITAASPEGPRYDVQITSAQRSSGGNGIWLCQSCSKLIDSDENRYTSALLHQWKRDAAQHARDAIAGGRPLGRVRASSALDAADEEFIRGLDLPSGDAVESVGVRLRAASRTDIAAFQAERGRPARKLALTLHLEGSADPNVTLDGVARLTTLAEPLSIVAAGGTGKSTTLMQLADRMLAEDSQVPLLVPLGEWSDRPDDFFDFVIRRNSFGSFRRQHLMQLAYHGRLVLLLDGWNELTPEARLRATRDVKALQRDYPLLGLVISTRRQALPVAGPTVAIEALSQDQQLELARSLRGQDGADLVDRAWRTPGVRDLVGIPLYLNALLSLPQGASFPETKEAVLRMFVQQHETPPDKVEALQRDTLGQHTPMLVGLAVEANRAANTVISDSSANRTVSSIITRLSEDGQIQIGAAPQPRHIINCLVGAHLLVRAAGPDGAISFQHQLFQEWYAAAEVEKVMLQSAAGDVEARKRLREDTLNWPSWEESILFACDRLSRANETGARAVAGAIEDTLGIDPILAGAMLDRATVRVWLLLRERVLRFVTRWHIPDTVDRAVRFMVTSGKPEFADLIWPLASHTDDQIQFQTFRASDPFRPGVLGPDCEARMRSLPTPQRKLALSEIAYNSGFDGMELAAKLAAVDPDPDVIVAVVESLAFRRGDRHVDDIMKVASDAVWNALGEKGYPDHLTDPQLNARLAAAHAAARATETDPIHLLGRVVHDKPTNAEAQVIAVLGNPEISFKDTNAEYAIERAFMQFPDAVATGLIGRIAHDLPLPYRTADYLKDAPLIDSGPVAEAALDPSTTERRHSAAAAVVGPVTVSALFDQLFAVHDQQQALGRYEERLSKTQARLEGALAATREDVFVPALVARARTDDLQRIGLLSDLLARHGGDRGNGKLPIGVAHRATLRNPVKAWIATLRAAPSTVRYASSQVARATERLADASLAKPLRLLLERDLTDYAAARAAYLTRRSGPMPADASTVYSLLYARAFAAMRDAPAIAILIQGLSDLRWGIDAAGALHKLWSVDQPSGERRIFGGWTDFSQHLQRRSERATGTPDTSHFAEAIFDVVRTLGNAAMSDAEQQHSLTLAVTGLALPHGAKRREIDALLALPQPIACKHRLLVAAAKAGEVVPAALLMDGLRDVLTAAQTQAWRLEENRGELMGWIDLFPFSDDPEKVLEALALLPEQYRRPHALRRLLETLPQSPPNSALAVLERLVANNPTFLQQFEWMNALIEVDTDAAALVVLDWLCEGRIPVRDGFRLSNALAGWARKYPTIRAGIIACYRALPAGNIRKVLEMAMNELIDEEVFMALFDGHIGAPHPFHGLAGPIRNLAIGRRPSDDWAGAFEEFGVPLTALRPRLFAMLLANDGRARLAEQCLISIEEHRDDRGRVSSEPRHPDIATGRVWPSEADELP
ncbi:MAG: hypothetical protein WD852_05815 [Methyloceanibacter sp.]